MSPSYPVAMAVEDFVPTLLAFAGFWLLASFPRRPTPAPLKHGHTDPALSGRGHTDTAPSGRGHTDTAPSGRGHTDTAPLGRGRTGVGLLWLGRVGACLIGLGGVAKSVWKLLVAGWQVDLPWLEGLLFPLMSVGAVLLLTSLLRTYWVLLALPLAAWQPFIVATAGVTLISVTGIVLAVRRRLWGAAVLFVLGIVGVMSLVPLRSHPQHETVTFQWIEQGTNTAAQLCFLLAAWLLARSQWPATPQPTATAPQTTAASADVRQDGLDSLAGETA